MLNVPEAVLWDGCATKRDNRQDLDTGNKTEVIQKMQDAFLTDMEIGQY